MKAFSVENVPDFTDTELDAMSGDDLMALRTVAQEAIARIRDQLSSARVRVAETGLYADRDWYRRANSALRFKGSYIQRIQAAMGRKRRHRGRNFERMFVEIAKETLPEGTYQQIFEAAQTRLEE